MQKGQLNGQKVIVGDTTLKDGWMMGWLVCLPCGLTKLNAHSARLGHVADLQLLVYFADQLRLCPVLKSKGVIWPLDLNFLAPIEHPYKDITK